jgi:hypothetical protein
MKKYLFLLAVLTLSFISCSDNEESIIKTETISQEYDVNYNTFTKAEPVKFHLIYVNWDSWGRTSRDCRGFGLCNYSSCTFCCTDANDNVVDCNSYGRIANSGIVTIFDETKQGYLIIKLSPADEYHLSVINNKEILYIDNDLTNEKLVLLKGEYLFDTNIGDYGGYKILAKEL